MAIRKMVAAGPAAHKEVALKLNTTLPVTSQEEKCNGMLKNYIFDHHALTKMNLLYLQHKRLYAYIHIFTEETTVNYWWV